MTRVQYKNWGVDSQGDIVGGVAYEVRVKSSGLLADIYDAASGGSPLSNPGTAEVGGDFTFWADPDLYDITIGVSPTDATVPWNAVDATYANAALRPYASRADAESAIVPAPVVIIDVLTPFGGVLRYERDGTGDALTTGLSQTWSPAGDVYPDHWAENTTPGTTDMASAFQSAVDFVAARAGASTDYGAFPAAEYVLFSNDYFIGREVALENSEAGVTLDGRGARIVSDASGPIFRFGVASLSAGGDTAGTIFMSGNVIRNVTFEHTSETSVASVALQLGKVNDMHIERCHFVNFWIAADCYRDSNLRVSATRFWNKSRSVASRAFIRFQGVNDSGDTKPGGGTFVEQCEFIGNASDHTLQTACIEMPSRDTLYMDNCHFIHAATELLINPNATLQGARVSDIKVVNCYFDAPCDFNVKIEGTVDTTTSGFIQDIEFVNCLFRGGFEAEYGIFVSMTDGGGVQSSRGGVGGVQAIGCKFRQHNNQAINMAGSSTGKLPVVSARVAHCDFRSSDGATAVVVLDAVSAEVVGNNFDDESTAPIQAVSVSLASASTEDQSLILSDNDFTRSTYTTRPFQTVTAAGAAVEISGNLLQIKARNEDQVYTGQTIGYSGAILWSYTFSQDNEAVQIESSVLGTETSGTDDTVDYRHRAYLRRSDAGTVSRVYYTLETSNDSMANNGAPAAIVQFTGTAWSASMSVAVGDVVTNSGNAYLVITSDGTAGATGPTHTSGAALLDGVRYLYLGTTNAQRVGLVVSGETGMTMRWAADVRARGIL